MKSSRLEQLSDGIFAIVMTILVFEIKAPILAQSSSALELSMAIKSMIPIFLSYILSFSLLFTYWRGHHVFISVYAQNIDAKLVNINAFFFLVTGLLPFSTSLLGKYSDNQLAIIIFGIHTIIIGLCLFWMRSYILNSDRIKNIEINMHEIHRGTIRIFVPMFFALIAILISFTDKNLSLWFFAFSVLFNFSHTSTRLINRMFGE